MELCHGQSVPSVDTCAVTRMWAKSRAYAIKDARIGEHMHSQLAMHCIRVVQGARVQGDG